MRAYLLWKPQRRTGKQSDGADQMNHLSRRVAKLEHSGLLTVSAPVLERFTAALDEAAHRLMGASYESIKDEPGAQERILEDVTSGFCRRLSHADEDRLIADLERIAGVSINDVIIPAADLADADAIIEAGEREEAQAMDDFSVQVTGSERFA